MRALEVFQKKKKTVPDPDDLLMICCLQHFRFRFVMLTKAKTRKRHLAFSTYCGLFLWNQF